MQMQTPLESATPPLCSSHDAAVTGDAFDIEGPSCVCASSSLALADDEAALMWGCTYFSQVFFPRNPLAIATNNDGNRLGNMLHFIESYDAHQ